MKKTRQLFVLLLCLCMAFILVPATASAGNAPSFSGGTGTQADPWLIATKDDLVALSNFVNSGDAADFDVDGDGIGNLHGYYFRQTADISLDGILWDPIGYSGGQNFYFSGSYDGGYHSISNVNCPGKLDADGYATAGIFGWIYSGSVQNLNIKNGQFTAVGQGEQAYAGGIAGVVYGASVTNCSVSESKVTSGRKPSNTNCAGGICGFSTGGTFSDCYARDNTVTAGVYAGGFAGNVEDSEGYGAGLSTFTGCYVADSSVSASSNDSRDANSAGGFAGYLHDTKLTIKNCFVYNTNLASTKNSGVFAGGGFANYSIQSDNCYFGSCNVSDHTGTAVEKSADEFSNGTVAGLLGEPFIQGGGFPTLGTDPADYSKVDAAIDRASGLNKNDYKDFSAVDDAINAVVRDKTIAQQSEVDAMAGAIEGALDALEYKDADYSKVDAAINRANSLNKNDYKDFSRVEAAIGAVVRGKDITGQAEVDAMAAAIEEAINTLEKKPAASVPDGSKADGTGQSGNQANVPQTGDESALALWAVMLLLAGGILAGTAFTVRKRKIR